MIDLVAEQSPLGGLERWLHDPAVTELMVNAGSEVWVERSGALVHVGRIRTATLLGAIEQIDFALAQVNSARSQFGAAQNRFESVIANLQVASESQASARSRIMDADFAAETAAMTRAQVLQQAGVAMLAQANQLPQNVLSLLKG